MNLEIGDTCWLDGDQHQEVIIVGLADSAEKLHDPRNDSDEIFSPFLPALSELVMVRHAQSGFEENVEPRRLRPAVAAHGKGVKRVELQTGAQ